MHVEESVKHEFKLYLSVVGGFIFLQGIFTTFSSILKSNAYMKEVMSMSVVMNIVNMVVNAVLIYGIGIFPELGILGVAMGTICGRFCAVVGIIIIYYKKIGVSLSLKNLKPFPTSILKKMLFIGIPSGGESVSYNITQLVTMTLINTFGQDDANAKIYCSMFAMVSWIFASSISQAVQILIGYCIGEKNYDEADRYVKSTLKVSIIVTLIVATMLRLLAEPLLSFVTTNPNVIALGTTILTIDIILEFGRSVNITMVRSLQATGDIAFPISIGIVSTWVISVGLSFVIGKFLGLGIIGVWIAMTCDECLRAIIFILRWKTGKWRTKNLI
jgi:Na+-driven multidrug efflux pump